MNVAGAISFKVIDAIYDVHSRIISCNTVEVVNAFIPFL
jgi:hypothetical protein